MDGNQKIYLKNVYVKQIITSVTLYPTAIYIFKTNNRNTRMSCEICSNLTIKTPERLKCRRSGVFIVEFELISHLFLLLTLSRWTGGFITLRSNEVVDKLVTFFQGYAKMLAKKKSFNSTSTSNDNIQANISSRGFDDATNLCWR